MTLAQAARRRAAVRSPRWGTSVLAMWGLHEPGDVFQPSDIGSLVGEHE